MNNRIVATIAVLGALGAIAVPTAPAQATTAVPVVSITGKLVKLADQLPAQNLAAIQLADHTLVPVASAALAQEDSGSKVTVAVVVPATVQSLARAGKPLVARGANGRSTTTALDPSDLAGASDGTPAPASTDIGRATIAAATSTSQPLAVAAVTASADPVGSYTPGTRHLYVALVTPRGASLTNTLTDAQVQSQVAKASHYWSAVTNGGVTFDVATISAAYMSAYDCSAPGSLWNEAAAKLAYPFSPDTSLVVELPPGISDTPGSPCGYGLGTVGASPNDSGALYVADDAFPVLAHELGHNMSLEHANALDCPSASDAAFDASSGSWDSPGCTESEYGDGTDVMSASAKDFAPLLSSPQSLRVGFIPASAATVITDVGTTSVSLRPLGASTTSSPDVHPGVRAAEVVDPKTGVTYYVEYRNATAPDTANIDGYALGVRVLRFDPSSGKTVLLDPTPTGWPDDDATLRVGSTFTSYSGGVRVTTLSEDATSAAVRISAQTVSGPAAPTATPDLVLHGPAACANGNTVVPVTVSGPAGEATGTVTLDVDGRAYAVATLSGGSGQFVIASSLPIGTHVLRASYSGDAAYAAADSATSLVECPAYRVRLAARSGNGWLSGSATAFVSDVFGRTPNGGTVTLFLGTRRLAVRGVGTGIVSFPVPTLPSGTFILTARVNGAQSNAVVIRVGRSASRITVRVGATHPRRAIPMLVSVGAAGFVPGGTVSVYAGSHRVAVGSLRRGAVWLTLPGRGAGSVVFKVVYSGGGRAAPATSWLRVVVPRR